MVETVIRDAKTWFNKDIRPNVYHKISILSVKLAGNAAPLFHHLAVNVSPNLWQIRRVATGSAYGV